jgi:hypothetical protein
LLYPKEKELLDSCRKNVQKISSKPRPSAVTVGNKVRAEFIRFLLLGGDQSTPVQEKGIILSGAWVEGRLSLSSEKIRFGFIFFNCHFDEPVNFTDVEVAGSVRFSGCEFPRVIAPGLNCSGTFSMLDCVIKDSINILNAKIGNDAKFSGSVVGKGSGLVLSANAVSINGDLFFGKNFKSNGAVSLTGAKIGGSILGEACSLTSKQGNCLFCDRIEVAGGVFFSQAELEGGCRFIGAQITGALNLSKAQVTNEEGPAFSADRAFIGGAVSFNKAICKGEVRFSGARLGGNISFQNANFSSKKDCAFIAERAKVAGNVFFTEGFYSSGKIKLNGMQISGNLSCIASTFENGLDSAFSAEAIVVEGVFFLRKMRKPVSRLELAAANLRHIVDDSKSWGNDNFIDGLVYQSFAGSAPVDAVSRLKWLDKQRAEHSGVNGRTSRFKPQPWKQLKKVLTEMGHFEAARELAIAYENRKRVAGLIGQSPETWWRPMRFATRYGAELVHWVFGLLAGYGYRPSRLIAWSIGVWISCSVLYWYAALNGVMAPSSPLIFQEPKYKNCMDSAKDTAERPKDPRLGNWYLCPDLPEEYTGFSPLAYSLDVLLPLVDLQQERDWAPKVPTPAQSWVVEFRSLTLKHLIRLVLWFEIIYGWVASLLVVAVVSGLAKRTEE